MRTKFVAGNWKMFTTAAGASELAGAVVKGLGQNNAVAVAVCPPFPYLSLVGAILRGSHIALGAQNFYPEREGAFTGEVGSAMLIDLGCRFVIVGHSERRHKLGETDSFVNQKVQVALAAGLDVILCVGETLSQRESHQTERVLTEQLTNGLAGVAIEYVEHVTLAYEPVWAIGTGCNATPDQAQEAHALLRERLAALYRADLAEKVLIQYGGSVNPGNAATLMSEPDVDGALVGGASLQAAQFLAIVAAATPKGG